MRDNVPVIGSAHGASDALPVRRLINELTGTRLRPRNDVHTFVTGRRSIVGCAQTSSGARASMGAALRSVGIGAASFQPRGAGSTFEPIYPADRIIPFDIKTGRPTNTDQSIHHRDTIKNIITRKQAPMTTQVVKRHNPRRWCPKPRITSIVRLFAIRIFPLFISP